MSGSYALAVGLETSWDFLSTGVAMTGLAYFLVIRKFVVDGAFYQRVVRPLADASYGTYLIHMFVLAEVVAFLQPRLTAPLAIAATAALVADRTGDVFKRMLPWFFAVLLLACFVVWVSAQW